ncbi:glycosyltransferase family 2 protein [Pseudarthrobacter sp. S9]|uniref:glycosyltransferase family 2 protein n=1 Tax=Pseudarthrobacter sp. S9 TaxID=3418421 RepID=UPI003D054474
MTEKGAGIDVVLPCLNEAAALPRVLAGLPATFRPIVVDNGSTDGSAAIARALGATVVFEPRTGFGWAAHAGLLAATSDYVAFCDCDGSMGGEDLLRVAAPVLAGRTDLMLGRRRPAGGSWPFHARLANAVLARRLRRRLDISIHDLGPMRVASRQRLLALDLQDRRSGYPLEMVLKAARAGWRIEEIPVAYRPRTGRSKVTGTVRGTITAVIDMSRQLRSR